MIVITLDTDWAPDYILENCFDLLVENGIKATVFATNQSRVLEGLDKNLFEIGLHPKFSDFLDVEEEISRSRSVFPNAVSLRSHSLCHSSRFLPIFSKMGIRITSNYLAFLVQHLKPILQPFGLVEYPIYFMDDAYILMHQGKDKYQLSSLNLDSPGIKVFAFHPIHIFLNTESMNRYEKSKNHNSHRELRRFVNRGLGVRDLFRGLIEHMSVHSIETFTLSEVNDYESERNET
jgi:hypothetical protein